MEFRLDLHVHSQASFDGRMTVEEIVAAAWAKNLDGVAICDHDVVYTGPTEVDGMLVIPGVELSTEHGHLLGLFVDRPIVYTTWKETIQAIHQAGGLAVLAHPYEHGDRDISDLLPDLDGLERWNSRANRNYRLANLNALMTSVSNHIPGTGGSDAHVPQEVGNGCTRVELEELTLESLRSALAAGKGKTSGWDSSPIHVARSQYTKLKKTHAPPLRYGKWLAFALKCLWQDRDMAWRKWFGIQRGKWQYKKWKREWAALSQEERDEIQRMADEIDREEGEQDSCP